MTKFEYSTVVPSSIVGFVSTYTYGVGRAKDNASIEALKEENGRLMRLQLELGCVLVSSEIPEDLENKVLEMREEFRNKKHNMNTRYEYSVDSVPIDGYTQQHVSDTSGMGRSRAIGGEVVLGLPDDTTSVDFGTAIEALKSGKVVTRRLWETKSIGLTLQFGSLGNPYIYIVSLIDGVEGHVCNRVPWMPSQSDMLSEDWVILG